MALLSITILVACNSEPSSNPIISDQLVVNGSPVEDGIYFAMEDEFSRSGWRYTIIIEVTDGKMTHVDWNAAYYQGGKDKKTLSEDGEYGMVAYGNASAEWHEQALAVESFVLEKQNVEEIVLREDGRSDVVSGATIRLGEFVNLFNKAIDQGPVGFGKFEDGPFFVQASEPDRSGWVDQISGTVIGGRIASVYWTAVNTEYEEDKRTLSEEGIYSMTSAGAVAEWHEQAEAVEAFLIAEQSLESILVLEDGKTDVISGATMRVNTFVELLQNVLVLR